MIRILPFLITLLLPLCLQAQTPRTAEQKKARVVQDESINDLVYNKKRNTGTTATPAAPQKPAANAESNKSTPRSQTAKRTDRTNTTYAPRQRYNDTGYRIQIYTGGSTRNDKTAALRMQKKARQAFPELAAYVHFISPHWVCRVGDFRHKEDAQRYATKLRNKKIAFESRVVTSNIIIAQ